MLYLGLPPTFQSIGTKTTSLVTAPQTEASILASLGSSRRQALSVLYRTLHSLGLILRSPRLLLNARSLSATLTYVQGVYVGQAFYVHNWDRQCNISLAFRVHHPLNNSDTIPEPGPLATTLTKTRHVPIGRENVNRFRKPCILAPGEQR